MQLHMAKHDFMAAHQIVTDQYGNCRFQAIIEYKSPLKNTKVVSETTFVNHGYREGEINLAEAEGLSVDEFHLYFSADWQVYTYSKESKKLKIKGHSPKMGGNYNVTIFPA